MTPAKKRLTLSLLVVLAILAFFVTPALAAQPPHTTADPVNCDPFNADGTAKRSIDCPCSNNPDDRTYCASATELLAITLVEKVQLAQISAMKFLVTVYWLLARVLLWLTENVLTGQWQATVRESLLNELTTIMGGRSGVLVQIVGGGAGLFGIALLLAGLFMTFPMLEGAKLVKVDRVLVWGALLMALFIGSSYGFDLIGGIEALRVQMMMIVSGGAASPDAPLDQPALLQDKLPAEALSNLITIPMMASDTEAHTLTNETLWTLPLNMTARSYGGVGGYFPSIDDRDKKAFRVTAGSMLNDQLELIYRAEMVKPSVIEQNTTLARMGLVRMAMGYYGAMILALFGLVFIILTVASLIMIVFFVAALPLGFFEFGGQILLNLGKQYMGVVALSLFAALTVRLMGGLTANLLADLSSFSAVLTYLASLTFVLFFLVILVKQALGVTDGVFAVMSGSLEVAAAAAGAQTSGPVGQAVKDTGQTLSTAVVAAGVGLATGGAGLALMGGAGALLGGSKGGREAASTMAQLAPQSQALQTLSTAAHSGSPAGAMTGLVRVARQRQGVQGGARAAAYSSRPLEPRSGAVAMGGGWMTTDLAALKDAEKAYFQDHDRRGAYRHLERAFGSHRTAEAALGAYDREGRAGAERVRRIAETTQTVADASVQRGQPLHTPSGELSKPFQNTLGRALQANGALDPQSPQYPQDAALAEQVAGAVVRRLESAWGTPQAAGKLARDTADPSRTEVLAGDVSAQYRLRDLAQERGWSETTLGHAYAHYPEAQRLSQLNGAPMESALFERLRADAAFSGEKPETLREAARLIILTSAAAQVQQPASVTLPAQSALAPAPQAAAPAAPTPVDQPAEPVVTAPANAAPVVQPTESVVTAPVAHTAAPAAPASADQPVEAASEQPQFSPAEAADEAGEVFRQWRTQRIAAGELAFSDPEAYNAQIQDLAAQRDQAIANIQARTAGADLVETGPEPASGQTAPHLDQGEADVQIQRVVDDWSERMLDAGSQFVGGETSPQDYDERLQELAAARDQAIASIQARVPPAGVAAAPETVPTATAPAPAPAPAAAPAAKPAKPARQTGKGKGKGT
jgi:hypothetical protein